MVILVYKTAEILEKKYRLVPALKYWAAFFYAIAVYPIQAAHFFTVDTFLNLLMFASFYFALRRKITASAVFFGLALASKASAIFILPLVLILMLERSTKKILLTGGLFLLVSYFVVHLTSPNYFQSTSLFDPTINANFINSLKELKSFEGNHIWYPPAVQWINRPVTFVLTNLAIAGVGLPYFVLIVFGACFVLRRRKDYILLFITFWATSYFTYLSFQFVKAIRYTIFLYPFFALLAALGLTTLLKGRSKIYYLGAIILVLIWPLLFSTIYFHKNTRVEASEWIYKNLSNGSYILSEYWDDPLPLPVEKTYGKAFMGEQLPVFDPDSPEKWAKLNDALSKADYYVLSSNRGWGSIGRVPEKYPQMSRFYKDLLAGKNPQFTKIKEFTPYYYQFLKLPEDWVEESFTVYDHPTVLIFTRNK